MEPAPAKTYRFGRDQRLQGRLTFAAIYRAGARKTCGPLAFVAAPSRRPLARLGLSVPRRVGTAPRRNRIKRLLREAFRLGQHDRPTVCDMIIVVRPHEPLPLSEYRRLIDLAMHWMHRRWQNRDAQSSA